MTIVNWHEWQFDWYAEEKNGLILKDVRFNGRLYISKINVPVIRVHYVSDAGPFNDQIGEDGFFAFTDCGNNKVCFTGLTFDGTDWIDIRVGCHIGNYTILQAYEMSRDGRMNLRIWSKGVHDSAFHVHHVYWRMDFDIDGQENDALWVRNSDSANSWQKVTVESNFSKAIRNRLDVFARGSDSELWSNHWDGLNWGGWSKRGGFLKSAPAAISRCDDRIDVFIWGTDDHVGHLWWNGSWKGWQDLGHPSTGGITASPAVASKNPEHISLFARGADNALYNRAWHDGEWTEWFRRGGEFKDAPTAVSHDHHNVHVFVRGMDDKIWFLSHDGTGWQNWQNIGHPPNVPIASGPAVSSRRPGRLEVFARGSDNALWYKTFTDGIWSDWKTRQGEFKDAPTAVSWGPNNINVLVRGMDNKIGRLWWDNVAGWQGWEALGGGVLTSGPGVCTRAFVCRCAVEDSQTNHGVLIVPGPLDGRPDDFSKADYAVRLYHPDEDEEWPNGAWGGLGYDNGENVNNKDIVVWYIAHIAHDATHEPEGEDGEYHSGGPTLKFY